jgi:hypothetical protein
VKKTSKKAKSPAKAASKRKVAIKDLKAKDAGSVKGGALLKAKNIVAESTDDKHKDWIEIDSF